MEGKEQNTETLVTLTEAKEIIKKEAQEKEAKANEFQKRYQDLCKEFGLQLGFKTDAVIIDFK